jgi:hypothetical protein
VYDTRGLNRRLKRRRAALWATRAIEGGVQLWHLATIMGTSVVQLEDTYARWLKRTDEQLRATFDAYDASFRGDLGAERPESGYADERT